MKENVKNNTKTVHLRFNGSYKVGDELQQWK